MKTLVTLSKGEEKVFKVFSRPLWNHSGFQINLGEVYNLEVKGDQRWIDFYIPASADGYPSALLRSYERFRRVPEQNWFKLIGTVDDDIQHPIVIGRTLQSYSPKKTGELLCFANDMEAMYWNNWGCLTVTLTRTS